MSLRSGGYFENRVLLENQVVDKSAWVLLVEVVEVGLFLASQNLVVDAGQSLIEFLQLLVKNEEGVLNSNQWSTHFHHVEIYSGSWASSNRTCLAMKGMISTDLGCWTQTGMS